jgi:hypothetical protein
MSLEKRDAGAMKITLEDMVKASGNNATDLWELVEKHSPSNPDFALQVAKKILYGPNIFIRKEAVETEFMPWHRDEYAKSMLKSGNKEIAKLGSDWLESRMQGVYELSFSNAGTPWEIKKLPREEEETLKRIRGKHEPLSMGLSENERWVHKALTEIPGEERAGILKMAAQLCEWSPEAFDKIYGIYWDASPRNLKASFPVLTFVSEIENFYDKTKSLVDAGVDPQKAVSFAGSHTREQVEEVVKGIEKLKVREVEPKSAFALASTRTPKQIDQLIEGIRILKANGAGMEYAFQVDVAGLSSKFISERIASEFKEKTNEFLGTVIRNSNKLMENWEMPSAAKISKERALGAACEIASEKGIAGTDKIVHELLEACSTYAKKYEIYQAPRPKESILIGEEWLLNVLEGKQPVTAILHKSINELDPDSKTAYSIVGLAAGGLTLELAARIGSMNTELGIDTSQILLKKIREAYGDYPARLREFQKVYNSLWAVGKVNLEQRLEKVNGAARRYGLGLGELSPVMEHISKLGDEKAGLWLDKMPALLRLDRELGQKATISAVKAVKNEEQLKTFLNTFNALEAEIKALRSDCFFHHGKWKYVVILEGSQPPPGLDKIGEYYNMKPRWGWVGFEAKEGKGAIKLMREIPKEDKDFLIDTIRKRTSYTQTYYANSEDSDQYRWFIDIRTGERIPSRPKGYGHETLGGDTILHSERVFPVYLDMEDNFAPLFTKGFFEIFAKSDLPLEERLEAARKETEKFKKEFSEKREVKITALFRISPE